MFLQIMGQTTPQCGQRLPESVQLVFKADQAQRHWPWHAAIFYNESVPEYRCGGTVINAKLVLTAGHCVAINNAQLNASKILVSLGRLNLAAIESSGQTFRVIFTFSF